MELPLTLQGQQFLLAALMGVVFGLLYDFLRGLRRTARWTTHLLDVLFVLSFLFGSLLFALWIGNGEYRVFMLPGILLGMLLYFSTFGGEGVLAYLLKHSLFILTLQVEEPQTL